MSDRDLTILCVTAGEPYAQPFIATLAQDAAIIDAKLVLLRDGHQVHSGGFVESVLDEAVAGCDTRYVLRLDDDEQMSVQMLEWLRRREYRAAEHWAFPRRNLWPSAQSFIENEPLWPDLQTRLSTVELAGGRADVHAGSPHGTGTVAPCAILHHKFLARTRQEREQLVRHYDEIQPGAGTDYIMFSLPELYDDELRVGAIA